MTLRLFHRMIALALAASVVNGSVGAGFHPRPLSGIVPISNDIAGRRGGLPLQIEFASQALAEREGFAVHAIQGIEIQPAHSKEQATVRVRRMAPVKQLPPSIFSGGLLGWVFRRLERQGWPRWAAASVATAFGIAMVGAFYYVSTALMPGLNPHEKLAGALPLFVFQGYPHEPISLKEPGTVDPEFVRFYDPETPLRTEKPGQLDQLTRFLEGRLKILNYLVSHRKVERFNFKRLQRAQAYRVNMIDVAGPLPASVKANSVLLLEGDTEGDTMRFEVVRIERWAHGEGHTIELHQIGALGVRENLPNEGTMLTRESTQVAQLKAKRLQEVLTAIRSGKPPEPDMQNTFRLLNLLSCTPSGPPEQYLRKEDFYNQEIPRHPTAAGKWTGDAAQELVVQAGLNDTEILIVPAPAGTGKTTMLTELAMHYVSQGKQVGMLAPIHEQVNVLTEKLMDVKLPVVRLGNRPRFDPKERVKTRWIYTKGILDTLKELKAALRQRFSWTSCGTIYTSTVDGMATDRLFNAMLMRTSNGGTKPLELDVLIIDETSVLDIPGLLLAVKKLKPGGKLILVGDPAQFLYFGLTEDEKEYLETQGVTPEAIESHGASALEWLLRQDPPPGDQVTPLTNYRSDELLVKFASAFYGYHLRAGSGRPGKAENFILIDTSLGAEKYEYYADETKTHSAFNETSARAMVDQLYDIYQRGGVQPGDIMIAAPYQAQVDLYEKLVREKFGDPPATIDPDRDDYNYPLVATSRRSESQQRKIVGIDYTRSDPSHSLGFLTEPPHVRVPGTRPEQIFVVAMDVRHMTQPRASAREDDEQSQAREYYRYIVRFAIDHGTVVDAEGRMADISLEDFERTLEPEAIGATLKKTGGSKRRREKEPGLPPAVRVPETEALLRFLQWREFRRVMQDQVLVLPNLTDVEHARAHLEAHLDHPDQRIPETGWTVGEAYRALRARYETSGRNAEAVVQSLLPQNGNTEASVSKSLAANVDWWGNAVAPAEIHLGELIANDFKGGGQPHFAGLSALYYGLGSESVCRSVLAGFAEWSQRTVQSYAGDSELLTLAEAEIQDGIAVLSDPAGRSAPVPFQMAMPPIVTQLVLPQTPVPQGGDYKAGIQGRHIELDTQFDLLIRYEGEKPGDERLEPVWQKGPEALHPVRPTDRPGTYRIAGIRAHRPMDEHAGPFQPLSEEFQVAEVKPQVSGVSFRPKSARQGASYRVILHGVNLTEQTWVDATLRLPDGTEQVLLNWQQGPSAIHQVADSAASGPWTLTALCAHHDPDEHPADRRQIVHEVLTVEKAPEISTEVSGVQDQVVLWHMKEVGPELAAAMRDLLLAAGLPEAVVADSAEEIARVFLHGNKAERRRVFVGRFGRDLSAQLSAKLRRAVRPRLDEKAENSAVMEPHPLITFDEELIALCRETTAALLRACPEIMLPKPLGQKQLEEFLSSVPKDLPVGIFMATPLTIPLLPDALLFPSLSFGPEGAAYFPKVTIYTVDVEAMAQAFADRIGFERRVLGREAHAAVLEERLNRGEIEFVLRPRLFTQEVIESIIDILVAASSLKDAQQGLMAYVQRIDKLRVVRPKNIAMHSLGAALFLDELPDLLAWTYLQMERQYIRRKHRLTALPADLAESRWFFTVFDPRPNRFVLSMLQLQTFAAALSFQLANDLIHPTGSAIFHLPLARLSLEGWDPDREDFDAWAKPRALEKITALSDWMSPLTSALTNLIIALKARGDTEAIPFVLPDKVVVNKTGIYAKGAQGIYGYSLRRPYQERPLTPALAERILPDAAPSEAKPETLSIRDAFRQAVLSYDGYLQAANGRQDRQAQIVLRDLTAQNLRSLPHTARVDIILCRPHALVAAEKILDDDRFASIRIFTPAPESVREILLARIHELRGSLSGSRLERRLSAGDIQIIEDDLLRLEPGFEDDLNGRLNRAEEMRGGARDVVRLVEKYRARSIFREIPPAGRGEPKADLVYYIDPALRMKLFELAVERAMGISMGVNEAEFSTDPEHSQLVGWQDEIKRQGKPVLNQYSRALGELFQRFFLDDLQRAHAMVKKAGRIYLTLSRRRVSWPQGLPAPIQEYLQIVERADDEEPREFTFDSSWQNYVRDVRSLNAFWDFINAPAIRDLYAATQKQRQHLFLEVPLFDQLVPEGVSAILTAIFSFKPIEASRLNELVRSGLGRSLWGSA